MSNEGGHRRSAAADEGIDAGTVTLSIDPAKFKLKAKLKAKGTLFQV